MAVKHSIIYLLLFHVVLFRLSYGQEQLYYTQQNLTESKHYTKYVYTNINNHRYYTQKEVLSFKDYFYTGYYCKDDMCMEIDNEYEKWFIEFPNNHNGTDLFIAATFTRDEIQNGNHDKMFQMRYGNYSETISFQCTENIQCLSNECFILQNSSSSVNSTYLQIREFQDNVSGTISNSINSNSTNTPNSGTEFPSEGGYCVFNDKHPIIHCDDIYSSTFFSPKSSYMHCGKPYGDTCTTSEECSSMECYNQHCEKQLSGPSDSDATTALIRMFKGLGILILIICFCCCGFWIIKSRKKHNSKANDEFKQLN